MKAPHGGAITYEDAHKALCVWALLSHICSNGAVEMIRVVLFFFFPAQNLLSCNLFAAVGASVCFITETDHGNK